MATSDNKQLSEELARSLESATALMQDLLGDIKDNATSLALVKAKLESLSGSVESLSKIVRDGNGKGSMITRLALAEKSLEDIEDGFDELKVEITAAVNEIRQSLLVHVEEDAKVHAQVQKFERDRLIAKLKIVAVVAPGAIALAILIIKMLMGVDIP